MFKFKGISDVQRRMGSREKRHDTDLQRTTEMLQQDKQVKNSYKGRIKAAEFIEHN